MRFVTIKMDDQLDLRGIHRDRLTIPSAVGVDTGQAKASKAPASGRGDSDADVSPGHAPAAQGPSRVAKAGKISGDLQATTMMIMGTRVYLHAPTGRLFLEIGKAPAFPGGINIFGTQEDIEAAESDSAGSGPAKRKRRAAS